jgi:hypothetical protein
MYLYLLLFQTEKGKQKPRQFSLSHLPFFSPCKRKLVVCLFAYEETNGSYPFEKGLNGLNGLAHSMHITSTY